MEKTKMVSSLSILFRSRSVELHTDARFGKRVKRLAGTALIALGVIFFLALRTQPTSRAILPGLLLGWILMPIILWASLRRPLLRYALIVPSLSVGLSLIAICSADWSRDQLAFAGWLTLTIGIWMGGLMGIWLWYRWFPVPAWLDDPFSPARWLLIGVHVGLIVFGIALVEVAFHLHLGA